ncbi:MAG: hypothetical protein B7Y25_05895 [Alphaproteobacteria bacterium 16-39-46]|nr:MAG: hypothetical protein B7Y25_05895 [Alphaproteobacteria bacterium 16-39-46]OZA42457.1 MAG: hypothetical protein B7X84_05955 [Alphaproteobacteria bacterium 17-39-52]HQS83536.1 trypsin-like serine protease [Alphaproteobacteria bacterium]HQS93313.1 trypsin-like serine protease [Alphaproteobacteria bacterium]
MQKQEIEFNHSVVSSPYANPLISSFLDKRSRIRTPVGYPWGIHGFLETQFSDHIARGSATFISKSCILTAAHCLYSPHREEPKSIVFYLGMNQSFKFDFRRGVQLVTKYTKKVEGLEIYVHSSYLEEEDENYDFGIVKLGEDTGREVGWASLKSPDHNELESMQVNVTGYPASKSPFNMAFHIPSYNMYTMSGLIKKISKHKIYYDIDTSGGQSGSGVWRINQDKKIECVGVHTTGGSKLEGNGAVRMNQENISIISEWLSKLGEI